MGELIDSETFVIEEELLDGLKDVFQTRSSCLEQHPAGRPSYLPKNIAIAVDELTHELRQ